MSEQYYNLIKNWHIKATQEDFFSKFVFEYLAFIAFITTQKYTKSEIVLKKQHQNGKITDRDFIQTLKQDKEYKAKWKNLLDSNDDINKKVKELHDYLFYNPLIVKDGWWDNDSYLYKNNYIASGHLKNEYDYRNIIEFWYTVRNNLFHGTKGPEVERDQIIVKHGFITLSIFVENILINDFEKNRMYPFYGHEFLEKFYDGDAEVTEKAEGGGRWANIYELIFLTNEKFPVIIENKTFYREDLIEKVTEKLNVSIGTEKFNQIISRLKGNALNNYQKGILKKYFTKHLKI